jgi:hypothetical protein
MIEEVFDDREGLRQGHGVGVVVGVVLPVAQDVPTCSPVALGSIACSPASPGSSSIITMARVPFVRIANSRPSSCSNHVSNNPSAIRA